MTPTMQIVNIPVMANAISVQCMFSVNLQMFGIENPQLGAIIE